ncbi:ImmA/IrrE family metallo-endopeptidase [Curtobacterium sp. MCBA15_004]|uniref:ImmA/IrrE family metallo-endopeptidase n=1 Tax=Curtobacterium sp. MCBA15_004 TaxID=1898733 RepID=UPI002675CF9A|nr:ImmA/IrrE family metallo-endopeptidase [Curtobacterium sp. MCBA15_004]WIA97655.1 ImmA/IrrE family metallo-endopeptidase [Curtobacterium sp. MCBA15_004]
MRSDTGRSRRTSLGEVARSLGVRITYAPMPAGVIGYYNPLEHRVYADVRCTPDEKCSVIAHELGHVHHGHTCDLGADSPIERQADAYAARLLIEPTEYARAELLYSGDVHAIADELCVTVDLVQAFQSLVLARLGERTYASGRRVS